MGTFITVEIAQTRYQTLRNDEIFHFWKAREMRKGRWGERKDAEREKGGEREGERKRRWRESKKGRERGKKGR